MKAFLSHSSKDAEFVLAVAEELGRQFTWLDRQQFDTGDEFLAAMERGIAESSVFVLFASKHSLASTFVDFEVTAARQQFIARELDRVLVFLLDESTTYRDLPTWLQRFQATSAASSRQVARAIRYALEAQARSRQRALFVGRTRELGSIESGLLPADGSPPPRVMMVSGLPGVGRRTLLERVARDHWGLPRIVEIRVEGADDLHDVALRLSDRFEAYNRTEELRAIAARIREESQDTTKARIARYLQVANASRELPVFIDAGGLLTNDAEPSAVMTELLSLCTSQPGIHVAFVASRRLNEPVLGSYRLPSVAVHALSDTETRQLVSALAAREQLVLGPDLVATLGSAAAGYPPSCYHVIELVRNYGIDVAIGDKNRLVSSRLGPLTRYLKALTLPDTQREILKVLATNSPLPFGVLGSVLSKSAPELSTAMSSLIDACLVVPGEDSWYRLAEPVVDVVIREIGEASKDQYAGVADALNDFLRSDSSGAPKLEFARVLFRAHLLADDDTHREASLSLASDLLAAAKRMYHRRDYSRAIEYCLEVLQQRPRNYEARYTLVRARIKLGIFAEAGSEIAKLRTAGYLRESAFLTGFLERHRGRPREAIEAYRSALQRGYAGIAIQRELAQCYLTLDMVDEAKSHIGRASRNGYDNPYVVDLRIQIATKERDEAAAVEGLAILEALDEPEFYHHRRSTVLAAFGKNEDALDAARSALEEAGRPTFAMLTQIAVCEIRLNRLDDAAEHISRIEREFPNHNRDIQIGLRVQLEIAAHRFEDALSLWNSLSDKSLQVHLVLRRNAIAGLLGGSLTQERRVALGDELAELDSRLPGVLDSGYTLPSKD